MSYSTQGRNNWFTIHGSCKCSRRSSSLVVLKPSWRLGLLSHLGLSWAGPSHFLLKQPRESAGTQTSVLSTQNWTSLFALGGCLGRSRWQVLVAVTDIGQSWTSDLEVKGFVFPIINPQSPFQSKCWYINLCDWWKQTKKYNVPQGNLYLFWTKIMPKI